MTESGRESQDDQQTASLTARPTGRQIDNWFCFTTLPFFQHSSSTWWSRWVLSGLKKDKNTLPVTSGFSLFHFDSQTINNTSTSDLLLSMPLLKSMSLHQAEQCHNCKAHPKICGNWIRLLKKCTYLYWWIHWLIYKCIKVEQYRGTAEPKAKPDRYYSHTAQYNPHTYQHSVEHVLIERCYEKADGCFHFMLGST